MFNKKLPTFEMDVNGSKEYIDPNEDLRIIEGDLLTEFSEQPSKYAFYAGLYTDAMTALEDFRNMLKTYEADSAQEIRDRIQGRFGATERITEAKMESEYFLDEKWNQLNKILLDWEQQVRRLEVVKEAFKQRASMLWNIASTRKQEMMRLNPDNE